MSKAGEPVGFWTNRDTPVLIQRIKGQVAYLPNISEETLVSGTLQSWAAYPGLLRLDTDQSTEGAAVTDCFSDPNRPWLWRGIDKDAITISAAGGSPGPVTFSMRPSGIGRVWDINAKLNVLLSARQNLMLIMNYTDDGTIDNASFWFHFYMWLRY